MQAFKQTRFVSCCNFSNNSLLPESVIWSMHLTKCPVAYARRSINTESSAAVLQLLHIGNAVAIILDI